ncbi:hypothetical protein [Microbacterium sp. 3J1]|uniref:hypothetical protein n=1 Tax=Microbacterium sp. 3J1 TaxID=861269 RepID=UPI000A68F177|nr:hypothetical protein [Microbacterium sp. 3J1]
MFYAQVVESLRTRGTIKAAVWDVARDEPVDAPEISVPLDAVVLVDGIFLQRPELREIWDAAVWVHAPFEVSVPRGNARFSGNHDPDPEAPENHRYVGGQRLYLTQARPAERATWVWNNEVLDQPSLGRNQERRNSMK